MTAMIPRLPIVNDDGTDALGDADSCDSFTAISRDTDMHRWLLEAHRQAKR